MKKLAIYLSVSIILSSCGGPNGTSVETDGVLPGEHRVFVSKAGNIEADFGGLDEADKLCVSYANAAGLELTYKALLSDDSSGSASTAKNRLIIIGSIYTVTGSNKNKVAGSAAELWNSDSVALLNKIDWDEDGNSVSSGNVWTGSTTGGVSNGSNCTNWTDKASGSGTYGDVNNLTDGRWIMNNTQTCTATAHLYCISQD